MNQNPPSKNNHRPKKKNNVGRQILHALTKGISTVDFMKRGKIIAKSLGDLVAGHHPTHTCGSTDASAPTKRRRSNTTTDYEFSCSSTPAFRFHRSSSTKRWGPPPQCNGFFDFEVDPGADSYSEDHAQQNEEEKPGDEEVGVGVSVDSAAEEFIERFYEGLRSENYNRRG